MTGDPASAARGSGDEQVPTGPGDPGVGAGGPPPGDRIVGASVAGTAVFVGSAGLAAAWSGADVVALVIALALFVGGSAAFVAALVRAAARSRHEELTMAGVFFLTGAPKAVRRLILGSLGVEVVAAFVTAGLRPNSSLAFGILAPVWGQGLAGLWGARHGSFPPRPVPTRPGPRPGPRPAAAPLPDPADTGPPPAGSPGGQPAGGAPPPS